MRVKYNSIWIIIDKLTKYGYYIPYKEANTTEDLAYAFLKTIVNQYGLPEEIISDRDKLFTSKFWTSLIAQLGINHKLSTAYHPQTDGQTERLNQTLEQYLRNYIGFQQDDWVKLLPLVQFAYNSSLYTSTKMSPFYANYSYEPEAYKHPRKDPTQAEGAVIAVTKLKELQESLKKELEFVNNKMTAYANKKRSMEPSLRKGDLAYLLR
jgi:transposase InsO family protein